MIYNLQNRTLLLDAKPTDSLDLIELSNSLLFIGLLPRRFIATISKENQFSFSQINEDTLLVFIDEWSTNFLDEDILKRLLEG